MLTRDDLEQIREVVRDEVHHVVQTEVKGLIREEIQKETSPVKKQLAIVNRKLNRLQKDITYIVKDCSNAISHLRKRIEKN